MLFLPYIYKDLKYVCACIGTNIYIYDLLYNNLALAKSAVTYTTALCNNCTHIYLQTSELVPLLFWFV